MNPQAHAKCQLLYTKWTKCVHVTVCRKIACASRQSSTNRSCHCILTGDGFFADDSPKEGKCQTCRGIPLPGPWDLPFEFGHDRTADTAGLASGHNQGLLLAGTPVPQPSAPRGQVSPYGTITGGRSQAQQDLPSDHHIRMDSSPPSKNPLRRRIPVHELQSHRGALGRSDRAMAREDLMSNEPSESEHSASFVQCVESRRLTPTRGHQRTGSDGERSYSSDDHVDLGSMVRHGFANDTLWPKEWHDKMNRAMGRSATPPAAQSFRGDAEPESVPPATIDPRIVMQDNLYDITMPERHDGPLMQDRPRRERQPSRDKDDEHPHKQRKTGNRRGRRGGSRK